MGESDEYETDSADHSEEDEFTNEREIVTVRHLSISSAHGHESIL